MARLRGYRDLLRTNQRAPQKCRRNFAIQPLCGVFFFFFYTRVVPIAWLGVIAHPRGAASLERLPGFRCLILVHHKPLGHFGMSGNTNSSMKDNLLCNKSMNEKKKKRPQPFLNLVQSTSLRITTPQPPPPPSINHMIPLRPKNHPTYKMEGQLTALVPSSFSLPLPTLHTLRMHM